MVRNPGYRLFSAVAVTAAALISADPASAQTTVTVGIGTARTPLHLLDGMMTPSGLHFERSHSGIPDIDPDQHRLVIHGLVKQPLVFTLEALSRYPMTSRIAFVECAGNSGALLAQQTRPVMATLPRRQPATVVLVSVPQRQRN